MYFISTGPLDRVKLVARIHLLFIPSPKMLKELEATAYCI